ncbi:MAG: CPBP family intramembrane metalloprotease [Cytophagales bacterium]|nr:CPBP family intramembrane metalloprotease [Armatimonadota bacterium]
MQQRRRKSAVRSGTGAAQATTEGSDRVAGWGTLVIGIVVAGFLYWKNHYTRMGFEEYYLLNNSLLLWIPLCFILLCLRRDASEFGMTPGDLKKGARLALIGFLLFIPVLLFIAPTPAPQNYYIGNSLSQSGAIFGVRPGPGGGFSGGTIDWGRLVFHESVFGFYMFCWEWFFRGFLLFGVRKALPDWFAVVFQALLFFALHVGKPAPELYSSLAGGLLLGVIALRLRSFLPCFLIHWAISMAFDCAVLFFHFRR